MTVRRCRVCTTVINADVPEGGPEPEIPAAPAPMADHFDAGVIDRQVAPTRSRFGGGGGALAARLAAANGGEIPASYAIPSSDTSAAIEYEAEPFDPDALYRDGG